MDIDELLIQDINDGRFQAIDWGSSVGGSIDFAEKRLGLSPIVGIDIDPKKVKAAREAGCTVVEANATEIQLDPNVVSASFMFHFLEHLPSLRAAQQTISSACRASRDFVLIRQPYFSGDEELFRCGLKLAWSTWKVHTNKMGPLEFYVTLEELRSKGALKQFNIGYGIPIPDASDSQILPLGTNADTLHYNAEEHGPKPRLSFSTLFREICVFIRKSDAFSVESIGPASRVDRWIYPL
jgi:hypothetical protein